MTEHKLGTSFRYKGVRVKAVQEVSKVSCKGCFFANDKDPCDAVDLLCSGGQRKDKIGVIFVKVQK